MIRLFSNATTITISYGHGKEKTLNLGNKTNGADFMEHVKGRTKTVAVTGGAASGKSSVCRRLGEKGLTVISLDDVSKDLMRPGQPVFTRVVQDFGPGVVRHDGTLDRAALRSMISRDPGARTRLESVVQPAILEEMERRIRASETRGEPMVVVEVPLLFELNMESRFDVSVLVALDEEVQVSRLVLRDGVSEQAARELIALQMPLEQKKTRADIVIDNNGSPEKLNRDVDCLLVRAFEK